MPDICELNLKLTEVGKKLDAQKFNYLGFNSMRDHDPKAIGGEEIENRDIK